MGISYITGSSGFIGSKLLSVLKDKGHKVIPIPHKDITNIKLQPFTNFYFLSSYGNMYYHDDLDMIIKANLTDLLHIVRQAISLPFSSFVFISTSSVKLDVHTPYSRMKKAAEEVLLTYMDKLRLPISIIRPFSVTGVGEQREHLIPVLIDSCMKGSPVNLVPEPMHDYIDVDDVVEAIINISSKSLRGIFEAGWGAGWKNREVLSLIEKVSGRKSNVKLVSNMRSYDNGNWYSTNYKIRSWGWLPKKPLEQSIREMVLNYEKSF